ncbi:MAG: phosphomannomutase/phosphoglucomutase [Bacteroidota bacterium]
MGAFKAYDIRGIYNKDFNKTDVYKIGYYLPELLKTNKILVGRDVRTSSPELFEYLTNGITDAGADVFDLGLATTPYVYWATAKFNFAASVQITASHNSKEYNGMKISCTDAIPIGYDSGLNILEQRIKSNTPFPKETKGTIYGFDKKTEYISFLKNYVSDYNNLKISIDCSNGMASLFIKKLLGDQPHYLFFDLDGTFPNHEANPLVEENLIALKKHVLGNKSDVGIIFDGDADRVMFLDGNACFISPDLIIAVLAHYFYDKGIKDAVVLQDIRSSKSVCEYVSRFGYKMNTWRVGRAFAAPKLKEIGGLFGGEYAGHYYFKDFFYSDSGILACLMVLDVIAKMKTIGISFSELIRNISPYHSSGEINFVIEQKKQAMDAVLHYFSSEEKSLSFMDFDGYRVDFKHWWFNIRPSNTEPYLRFIAEADTESMLKEILEKVNIILNPFIKS